VLALKDNAMWTKGRLGNGYEKLCLCKFLFFDMYFLRFPLDSYIDTHTDPVPKGRHFRLNIVLKKSKLGGVFVCDDAMINTPRIKYFRPDIQPHGVSPIRSGNRFVLSIGWIWP
jgi:hypothetical protein